MGEKRNACLLFVGKPEGKRQLREPGHNWVDNIKIDLGEIVWGGIDLIGLVQDRGEWRALAKAVMKIQVS
jgi:hypothetical protein